MQTKLNNHVTKNSGFTLVELLIVIVVIGILAAISIVAYNGVRNMAHDSAVKAEVSQIYKQIQKRDVELEEDNDRLFDGIDKYLDKTSDGVGSFNLAKLNADGRAKIESYIGKKIDLGNLYSKGNDVSLIIRKEYDYISDDYKLVIYARSKSGKVFVHNGSLTRMIDFTDNSEVIDYLQQELTSYEYSMALIDGTGCPPKEFLNNMGLPHGVSEGMSCAEIRQVILDQAPEGALDVYYNGDVETSGSRLWSQRQIDYLTEEIKQLKIDQERDPVLERLLWQYEYVYIASKDAWYYNNTSY